MRRLLGIRFAAVGVALAGIWVASTQQEAVLGTLKITDDLHVITGAGGNVAVYLTDDGVVLVDNKFDRTLPELLEKVKSITDKPIRYVLNTHHHGDHTGGNEKLMETAEVVAHENARKNIVEKSQPGAPRITFSDEAVLRYGGKEVRAYYFGRGHTDGDAVIQFPALKVIHTGDLFIGSAPFIDYSAGGSGVEWPATLGKIDKLDFETIIPGHGDIMKRADLRAWTKAFQGVNAQVTAWKKEGKSKEEVAAALKLEEFGWEAGKFFMARSLPGLYDEIQ